MFVSDRLAWHLGFTIFSQHIGLKERQPVHVFLPASTRITSLNILTILSCNLLEQEKSLDPCISVLINHTDSITSLSLLLIFSKNYCNSSIFNYQNIGMKMLNSHCLALPRKIHCRRNIYNVLNLV